MASSHIPEESNPPPASILSKGSNAKNWGTKTREAVRFVASAITDSQTPCKQNNLYSNEYIVSFTPNNAYKNLKHNVLNQKKYSHSCVFYYSGLSRQIKKFSFSFVLSNFLFLRTFELYKKL